MRKEQHQQLPMIGWREWLNLPDLGIEYIKAKIDTGARSSALHAFDVHPFQHQGEDWVKFKVHPYQRESHSTIVTQAKLMEHRHIRNSGGHTQLRPVIQTMIDLGGEHWLIELTLTNRDVMGFRMLLGRQAIRRRFWVDPARSYLQSKAIQQHLHHHR